MTADGRTYYKNHEEKSTQWHHPLAPPKKAVPPVVSSTEAPGANQPTNGSENESSGQFQPQPPSSPPSEEASPTRPLRPRKPSFLDGMLAKVEGAFKLSKSDPEPRPPMVISSPTGFQHVTHVTKDTESATGFAGLPDKWEAVFLQSGISQAEANANPNAVRLLSAVFCFACMLTLAFYSSFFFLSCFFFFSCRLFVLGLRKSLKSYLFLTSNNILLHSMALFVIVRC